MKSKNWLIIIFGSIDIAAFTTFSEHLRHSDECEINYQLLFGVAFVMSVLIWYGNESVHNYLERKFPWDKNAKKRLILQVFINSAYTASLVKIFLFIYFNYVIYVELTTDILFKEVSTSVLIAMFINAIYVGNHFFKQWKKSQVEAERLKKENIQAQFETLKNQVNPHFLFNCLNTLATIILENQDTAVDFVQKLSNVYRYVLKAKDKDLVPLETEMEFVQSYIFLLKNRFGENIHFNINIQEECNHFYVAPLTVQMLIENAIKHNVISSEAPLKIDIITLENCNLKVSNNLQKKTVKEDSTKLGLDNIVQRYKFLTSRQVEVNETSEKFEVILPIVKIDTYESTDH